MLGGSTNRTGCFTQFFFNFGGFLGLVLGFGMKKHKVINFVTSFSNKDVSCTEVLAMPEQFF